MKTVRLMFDATGPQMSRQSLIATLEGGKQFTSNVFPAVKYSGANHFGGLSAHLLTADCVQRKYTTCPVRHGVLS